MGGHDICDRTGEAGTTGPDLPVVASGAVVDHPGKGHDRVFVDPDLAVAAVFDGAGGAEMSAAAAHALPRSLMAHRRRRPSPHALLAEVAADLDHLPQGSRRRSTAAVVCASPDRRSRRLELAWFHAGDASIHLLDRTTGRFARVAHTPAAPERLGLAGFVDVTDFLGAGRPSGQLARRVGHVRVRADHDWCLVCTSDGVLDDGGRGLRPTLFETLVREVPPGELPARVLENILDPYDDASVAVLASPTPASD